ncbi:MAG: hypothetical protein PUK78_09780 [Spirochaetales bacterium]|nr:hypothetical protein [Spirochaetales bacterium]
MDVAGIVWDVVDIAANPANPWAWASLAADVGCMFIPGATGGGRAIKAAESAAKISKAAKVAGKADDFVDAIKGGERIFGTFKDMKKVTKGFNHAIEAHHLVPQALADILGKKVDDFAAVVIDKATHNGYSKEWNAVLKTIRNSPDPKAAILKEAERIYKDAPDLLEVTKKWLESF